MSETDEKITAWVTTYALTSGIMKVEGHVSSVSDTMLIWGVNSAHGNDWHRTEDVARTRAEEMRKKKIAALKKSIAKLEQMTFESRSTHMGRSTT